VAIIDQIICSHARFVRCRVTWLGAFSPLGRVFIWGRFFWNIAKRSPHILSTFYHRWSHDLIEPKKWIGFNFGRIFSQNHHLKKILAIFVRLIFDFFKEVARGGGEQTRVLSISFIFSFSPLYRWATAAPLYLIFYAFVTCCSF
jgi:hypothetical protein